MGLESISDLTASALGLDLTAQLLPKVLDKQVSGAMGLPPTHISESGWGSVSDAARIHSTPCTPVLGLCSPKRSLSL